MNHNMYKHNTVHFHCTLYRKDNSTVTWKVAREEDLPEKWNNDLKCATQVITNRCVYQQLKKVDSRATFLLILVKTDFD